MQFTRFTIFHVFYLIGMCGGVWLGIAVGHRFGIAGIIGGAALGLIVGAVAGCVPDWLAYRALFRDIHNSSNDRLREIVDQPEWNFRQTVALMQLSARGVDVSTELPRIGKMLESDSRLTRIYGWDALRLVFTPIATRLSNYDPKNSVEVCRQQMAESWSS